MPHNYKLIENEQEAQEICDYFLTKEFLSLDTETTSSDAIDAELVGLSFSVAEKEAFYVAVSANREEALKMVNIFKPLYEDEKILKIGQNIKYDYEVLHKYGVTLKGKFFDTMIAHYLIQPELRHNMDYMAETLLNYKTISIESLIGAKGKQQKEYARPTSKRYLRVRLRRRRYNIATEKRARTEAKGGGSRRIILGNRDASRACACRYGTAWRSFRYGGAGRNLAYFYATHEPIRAGNIRIGWRKFQYFKSKAGRRNSVW